jgi:transcriptional regulator with XRE-family HTH domain
MKIMKIIQHNTLAAIRERLGLSQVKLAEHLGVSRATIGMTENGKRKLPVAALLKLAKLEISMAGARMEDQAASARQVLTEIPIAPECIPMDIRELQCQYKIQKLTIAVDRMAANYRRYLIQYRLVDAILGKEATDAPRFALLTLQLQRDHLLRQLAKYSPAQQSMLHNKIAVLSAESYLNRNMKEQFGNP